MSASASLAPVDQAQGIAEDFEDFRFDPWGCVKYSFPWGEGDLEAEPEPRKFQRKFFLELTEHLQEPKTRYTVFRKAWSSGHGIGKSAIIGMVTHWALSTWIGAKVLITANTGDQLKTKTQPEVSKWFNLSINKDWFAVHVTSIKINDAEVEQNWRADFATWSEDNPQAFAGAHNAGKLLLIIFDEASEISDTIYRTVEGALTDANTVIIWLCFSQCTRAEGAFYEATHGNQRHRWRAEVIDSREIEGTNIAEINESINVYGEDSDHVRVRYRGLFPLAGAGRYIDLKMVTAAQQRPAYSLKTDPLVAGVDFAWGGSDQNVVRFRKGLDARSIPPVKVRGEFTRDPAVMVGKLADVLNGVYGGEKVDMLFFDSAGIASAVQSGLMALGFEDRIMVVNFGADSPKPHCAYFRDFMWDEMKKWLQRGGAIDDDRELAADLQKPILVSDPKQRVKLESKDQMKARLKKMGIESGSPDDGDALGLTFAHPVQKKHFDLPPDPPEPRNDGLGWMG